MARPDAELAFSCSFRSTLLENCFLEEQAIPDPSCDDVAALFGWRPGFNGPHIVAHLYIGRCPARR